MNLKTINHNDNDDPTENYNSNILSGNQVVANTNGIVSIKNNFEEKSCLK